MARPRDHSPVASWTCQVCGVTTKSGERCDHANGVPTAKLSTPQRRDEYYEYVRARTICTCRHDLHLHTAHAEAPHCCALGCRCTTYLCATCKVATCTCTGGMVRLSKKREKTRRDMHLGRTKRGDKMTDAVNADGDVVAVEDEEDMDDA